MKIKTMICLKGVLFSFLLCVLVSCSNLKDRDTELNQVCGRYVLNEVNTLDGADGYIAPDAMLYYLDEEDEINELSRQERLRFFTVVLIATPSLDAGSLSYFLKDVDKYEMRQELLTYWKNILQRQSFNEEETLKKDRMSMSDLFLYRLSIGVELLKSKREGNALSAKDLYNRYSQQNLKQKDSGKDKL